MIDKIKEEQWTLMPFGENQYWIVHKANDKTTFIATVEAGKNEVRNKIIAVLLSKAPELFQMVETLYDGIRGTALEKTIAFYMIEKLLNEIKENGHTGSIRNT